MTFLVSLSDVRGDFDVASAASPAPVCTSLPRPIPIMSSLAAARADNFYFPPDWRPDQGAGEKGKKRDPGKLGARAAKSDQGILVIRQR